MLICINSCLTLPTDITNASNIEKDSQTIVTQQPDDKLKAKEILENESATQDTDAITENAAEVETSTELALESSRNVENLDHTDDFVKISNKDFHEDIKQNKQEDKEFDKWNNFENDFNLLEQRLPDLTSEEMHEISKEDSIPWNFLKRFDMKSEVSRLTTNRTPEPQTNISNYR